MTIALIADLCQLPLFNGKIDTEAAEEQQNVDIDVDD